MVHFTKLRLTGFKSFVDPTELMIERGLTGVVGPNGCGKSNLVEALKWVMGETSAKQMRGGEMDDVIFGGTRSRPARNVAEVIIQLDNTDRRAPAMFNDHEDLEISRRIEREKGSNYRVNGRDVRARDVQLLFADAASGARSTALVSQGKIGAIIAAKPTQRRGLLEEAAGITGLHSRRHEAELRLRGAESNLSRLEDVLVTMDAQMASLRKQSRQATRYRNLSDHIRKAEATLYLLRWNRALDNLDKARSALKLAETKVAELAQVNSVAATKQAEAAATLPDLRKAEAEASAELQRVMLARETLDAEEARIVAAKEECERRLAQLAGDIERERQLASDAVAFIEKLGEEQTRLREAQESETAARAEAAEKLDAVNRETEEMETRLAELTDAVAAGEARRNDLEARIHELDGRTERLAARREEINGQKAALQDGQVKDAEVGAAEEAVANAEAALEEARVAAEAAEGARNNLRDELSQAQADKQAAESALNKLEAEERALSDLLATGEAGEWPPLIDSLAVEPGFETALAVALGEDLNAALDQSAPVRWTDPATVVAGEKLPTGVQALDEVVKGASVLTARLSQIGVVEDWAAGEAVYGRLKQGQRLVSRDGGFWRWDGLLTEPGVPTAAAARLKQRNRLKEIKEEVEGARADVAQAADVLTQMREKESAAIDAERAAREAAREKDRELQKNRSTFAELRQKAAELSTRLAGLVQSEEQVAADLAEAEAQLKDQKRLYGDLPEPGTGREKVASLRAEVAEKRARQLELQSAYDRILRDAEDRSRRMDDVAEELKSWQDRKEAASAHVAEREERRAATTEELERLKARPEEIAKQRSAILDSIAKAEEKRTAAADRLAADELKLAEVERALRESQTLLAQAREERVRTEAAVEQGNAECRSIAERIAETLDCRPDDVREVAELGEDEDLPPLDAVENRLERLQRERDNMGPVNLRAEAEAQELGEQMDTMESQKADLLKAIDKLRRGIGELNREGRERLLTSFKEVDRHFQDLFTRLFGGGRAHLELTESDDPLEAGLEIMASPPGKRLQTLSLLSGGEQALTALALLFGVFMTNPAPICVLDEVDAPLDDANVDRFCTMLEEIAHSGATRFLIITHHRMTMARMDRLFGVTMSERGVSQLVSVDLRKAEEIRATA